jgi:transposase
MLDAEPIHPSQVASLSDSEVRELAVKLLARVERDAREIVSRDAKIEKMAYEVAHLRRLKFGVKSEQLNAQQKALFEEALDADIAALEARLNDLKAPPKDGESRSRPKRTALPPDLPSREIAHEPESTTCACGSALERIGEDVSQKLDYTPGVFTAERHVRGKSACRCCRTLTQAPVPPEVIDKGIPTAGLLAHVLVAKHSDHLPLYRQEAIFGRAGLAIPRSTLAAWVGVCGVRLQPLVDALKAHVLRCAVVHADETPVSMLAPGTGKTHRAYLWAYAAGSFETLRAVVYDFTISRAGEHARTFLGDWKGSLVCDDYGGYKALFATGVIECGCMAHARRYFVELVKTDKSSIAATAVEFIGQLYGIEREVKDMAPEQRLAERQQRARPITHALHAWLIAQRTKVVDGGATAKAIDYSLKRWAALMRYLNDPALPIDNNHDEQQIRTWATGRRNWLFAGTLLAGQRAAAITSLIQSAKLNGHDPYVYLKDVLTRLPTHKDRDIDQLLPHIWQPRS